MLSSHGQSKSAVYFRQFESINHQDHDFETATQDDKVQRRAVKLLLTPFSEYIFLELVKQLTRVLG